MDRHGRRLCELLEEQQELLEHDGYSDRAVNSAACICWLGGACRRLKRLSDYGFKRKKKAEVIDSHGVEFHRLSSSAATDEAEMDKEERSPVSVLALHSHEGFDPNAVEEESTSPSSSESTEESLPDCDENITISELIDRDLSESKKEWTQFERERREVGTEIELVIFEEIRRETALDLLLHDANLCARCADFLQLSINSKHVTEP